MTTPCPRCGHPLLAEATTGPDGQRTHPWCQHLPRCFDDNGKLECVCGLTDHIEART